MTKSRFGRLIILFVALLPLLAFEGCGSSGSSDASARSESSESAAGSAASSAPSSRHAAAAALRKAVESYSDAFLTGNVDAYGMLSQRCQRRIDKNEFIGELAAARTAYGSALNFKSYKAQISGDLARVTYTYEVVAINQDSEPWVRENDDWHEDDC